MKELLKSVEKLAAEELVRTYEKHPAFNSSHEGYAVILEEVDEKDAINDVSTLTGYLWNYVKTDCCEEQKCRAGMLKKYAIHAAAEAIQVAAMAQKYMDSVGGKHDGK